MSNFIKDTKTIDEKLNIEMPEVEQTMLEAAFLPYYVDPKSMKLTVILVRSLMPGAFVSNGKRLGLSCLKMQLPADEPLTIEEAYAKLGLPAALQNPIPFGSTMPNPLDSSLTIEMVLANIEPPELEDEASGIIYKEPGKFEIGIVEFDSIIEAIQENYIQDMLTRLLLNELYILAVEEANKQNENGQSNFNAGATGEGMIGNGYEQYPESAQATVGNDTPKTSDIPDEIIAENSQMDFGAIYSEK